MTRWLRRWPLHAQVLFALLVIVVLAMTLAGSMVRQMDAEYLQANLERHSKIMLSMLAGASLDAVISADIPVLVTVVGEAGQRDPDIVSVSILTRDRQRMAQWSRPAPAVPSHVSTYEQAISLEGETFGFIRIDWDITAQQQEIETHVRQIHVMVMAALLATIAVVLVMLGMLVLRPLTQIRSALLDLADRKSLDALEGVRTSREIDHIVTAVHALATAQDALTTARDRAESASRSKSEFLSIMGHELRTPLHCMMGMGELLAMTSLDAHQQECLETIQTSSRSLHDVLSAVLQYSSIDLDAKSEANPYDLSAMLAQQTERIRREAEAKELTLSYSVPADMPVLVGDERAVTQILQVLLGNAVKFTQSGGITVNAGWQGLTAQTGFLTIEVEDTGVGIPTDKLESIFEPFTQADGSATRNHEGIGLGLAIARQLVRKLDGTLDVSSSEGVGSVFRLRLTQACATETEGGADEPLIPVGSGDPDARHPADVPTQRQGSG